MSMSFRNNSRDQREVFLTPGQARDSLPDKSIRGLLASQARGKRLLLGGKTGQTVANGVHLPAYLADEGIGSGIATMVLALSGLLNIAGTYWAGLWGERRRKPMWLSWIYLARAVVIAGFVLLPFCATSAHVFGGLIGLFWLSTVPLTIGTVMAAFGVKHMAMLGGIVFFAHQLRAFMGGWLYDQIGSYDMAWLVAIALGLIAAILNWTITERTLAYRMQAA